MMMQFNFEKALQASAVVLNTVRSKRMSYLRLLKLLYIADRESLMETGRAVVPDRFFAMQNGPVLSELLNVIKDEHCLSSRWSRFVFRDNYEVELIEDPGNDKLSRYEIAKLTEVAGKHQWLDDWQLVDLTHTFAEWADKEPGDSSVPIPLEDVLAAVKRGGEAASIAQDAKSSAFFDEIFGAGETE